MIKRKTMEDGVKVKIITNTIGETIEQGIVETGEDRVWVKSGNGKTYPVLLSDNVRMTMEVNVGDIAVIKTFKPDWLVVDIIPAEEEEVLSPEEEEAETQRQIREFEDLLGGY